MNELNRGVIVLKPKKLFLDRVNSAGEEGGVLTLDEVSRDCTAYLTPEIEDDEELRKFLEQNYDLLFEQELVEWFQDEAQWPATRDFSTFQDWFAVCGFGTIRNFHLDGHLTTKPVEGRDWREGEV